MPDTPRISYPTRPSLSFAGQRLSPLQALALLVLADARRFQFAPGGIDGPRCCANWRRWLATNLILIEYQRKGWKTQALAAWWRRTITELRGMKLLPVSGLAVTDTGAAVAASLRPLFSAPMPPADLVALNRRVYVQRTGRLE